jgi:hypothetical protein
MLFSLKGAAAKRKLQRFSVQSLQNVLLYLFVQKLATPFPHFIHFFPILPKNAVISLISAAKAFSLKNS